MARNRMSRSELVGYTRWLFSAAPDKRPAARLERAVGRPTLPKGRTRAELQAAYVDQGHSLRETAEHFGVTEATVEKNLRRAAERRGQ